MEVHVIPYEDFRVEGKRLFYKGEDITKKIYKVRGKGLRSPGSIIEPIRDFGFRTFVPTPNKMEVVRKLAMEVNTIVNEGEEEPGEIIQIKTISNIRRIMHDAETLTEETPFSDAGTLTEETSVSGIFTERELPREY